MWKPKEITRGLIEETVKDFNNLIGKKNNFWLTIIGFKPGVKTKITTPIWEMSMVKAAKKLGINIKRNVINGVDFTIGNDNAEDKGSCTLGSSFTGNKHSSKVNKLIIRKMVLDDKGISKIFLGTLDINDLSDKSEKWSSDFNDNNGISTLKISKDDYSKINVVYGSLKKNEKWLTYKCEEVN